MKKLFSWLKKIVFVSAELSTNTKTAAKLAAAKEFLEELEKEKNASDETPKT